MGIIVKWKGKPLILRQTSHVSAPLGRNLGQKTEVERSCSHWPSQAAIKPPVGFRRPPLAWESSVHTDPRTLPVLVHQQLPYTCPSGNSSQKTSYLLCPGHGVCALLHTHTQTHTVVYMGSCSPLLLFDSKSLSLMANPQSAWFQ